MLLLLDDIAAVMDDVAMMTKVAARKTAGVLGDDLAVNAEKVTGVRAHRELPVVWAVAKGSFRNKCILVPAAMAISAVDIYASSYSTGARAPSTPDSLSRHADRPRRSAYVYVYVYVYLSLSLSLSICIYTYI